MAKKYSRPRRRWFRGRRGKGKRKIPLAIVLGTAATVLGGKGGGDTTLWYLQQQNWNGALTKVVQNFTGYNISDGTFDFMKTNLEPLIIGAVVHKAAGFLGINRAMAKVPLINI